MSTNYSKGYRSFYKLTVYILFVTKYRKKAISADILNRLEAIFQETLDKWGCQLVEFNGEAAHVAQFTCWSKFISPLSLSTLTGVLF